MSELTTLQKQLALYTNYPQS